jgi:hypothetical protein
MDEINSNPLQATAATTTKPKRRSRRPVGFMLTPRDVRILRDLFDSRVLTANQIADIHFASSPNAAKQRLWAMKKVGLISGRFGSPASEPQPLRLTRGGFDLLRQRGHLDDYPRLTWVTMSRRLKVSDLTLAHELDVGSVKAAFHRAARERGDTKIDLAVTWPRLLRFRVRPPHQAESANVSPDGFIRLTHTSDNQVVRQMDFFIEVDRSTETLSRIVERMQGYVAYFSTGGYAKRQGVNDAQAKDFPFRVLWTFRTKARQDGFLESCRKHVHPVHKMAWTTVHDMACQNPFGAVWRRPIDAPASLISILPIAGQLRHSSA